MTPRLLIAFSVAALALGACEPEQKRTVSPAGPAGTAPATGADAPPPPAPGKGPPPGSQPPPPAGDAQPSSAIAALPADGIVAQLGEATITRAAFDRAILDRASRVGVPPAAALGPMRPVIEESAMNHLIRRQALAEEGERRKLTPTDDVVAQKLAEFKTKLPEGATFDQFLSTMRTDEASFTNDLKNDLTIEALMKEVTATIPRVTEIEAKELYNKHPEVYAERKTATIRQILFKAPLGVPNNVLAEKQAAAAKLRAELDGKGVKAFAEAAKKHSEDLRTKDKGGSMGEVSPAQLIPDLSIAAFSLKKNELSQVLRTEQGFHLLYSEGVNQGKPVPFKEAKDRIIVVENTSRAQTELQKFVEATTQKLKVDIKVKPAPRPALPTGGPTPGAPGPASRPAGAPPGVPPGGFVMPQGSEHALPPPSADNVLPGAKNPHGGSTGGDLKMGGKKENPLKLGK